MAIVRVSDSGINGAKFRTSSTDRDGYALIDEGASTNGAWSILTNPLGDGKNFRVGYWSTSGSVVITESGTIDVMLVGAGANGSTGPPGFCGGGGDGGPIARTRRLYLNAGVYAVTVGAGGSGQSQITGPALQENWTAFRSGAYGTSLQSVQNSISFDHNGGSRGTGNNPGGGGPGGGGQGGPGVNASGGPAKSISGWTPSPISLGAGGPSSPAFIPVANSADGGGAGCPGGARTGGSGRVYIRYQI